MVKTIGRIETHFGPKPLVLSRTCYCPVTKMNNILKKTIFIEMFNYMEVGSDQILILLAAKFSFFVASYAESRQPESTRRGFLLYVGSYILTIKLG
jgi:hypothetical protein